MDAKSVLMIIAGTIGMIAGVLFTAIGFANDIPEAVQWGENLIIFVLGVVFGQSPSLVNALKKALGKGKM
jgi:hypothetical protein